MSDFARGPVRNIIRVPLRTVFSSTAVDILGLEIPSEMALDGFIISNIQDTHHFVVLVRENVAVPNVTSSLMELGLDDGHLSGKRNHNVFGIAKAEPASFMKSSLGSSGP